MRFRRALTLVALFEAQSVVLYNFLAQRTVECNIDALTLLQYLHVWRTIGDIEARFRSGTDTPLGVVIRDLVEANVLVVEGTNAASVDAEYEISWHWGPAAGLYHFATCYGDFISLEDGDAILRERVKLEPSPALYSDNSAFGTVVQLAESIDDSPLFATMARRRTNRHFSGDPVSLRCLSDLLYHSLKVTAILQIPDIVDLPLKMTPSGGARNPYEAFVYARNVTGLPVGIYHYSALDHTLGALALEMPPMSTLAANQAWADDAAAMVVLVANFDRPMWKYRDPGAYRIVLIEAGHIAQNMMLVATHHGATANPTAAFTQNVIEASLHGLKLTQAPVYAVLLGRCRNAFEWE